MGVPDRRPFRRDFPPWGWALGGAVALPAILLAASVRGRFPALAILCLLISAGGIAAGAAITAIRRGDLAWKAAAGIWLVAYTAGAATYAFWPARSERLARPGEVNQITLPRSVRIRISSMKPGSRSPRPTSRSSSARSPRWRYSE